jgi:hypothetical protein
MLQFLTVDFECAFKKAIEWAVNPIFRTPFYDGRSS